MKLTIATGGWNKRPRSTVGNRAVMRWGCLIAIALLPAMGRGQSVPADLQAAARRFRIQVYYAFHADRHQYDRWIAQGQHLLQQWQQQPEPQTTRPQVIGWYRQAIAAAQSRQPLPALPDLSVARPAVQPVTPPEARQSTPLPPQRAGSNRPAETPPPRDSVNPGRGPARRYPPAEAPQMARLPGVSPAVDPPERLPQSPADPARVSQQVPVVTDRALPLDQLTDLPSGAALTQDHPPSGLKGIGHAEQPLAEAMGPPVAPMPWELRPERPTPHVVRRPAEDPRPAMPAETGDSPSILPDERVAAVTDPDEAAASAARHTPRVARSHPRSTRPAQGSVEPADNAPDTDDLPAEAGIDLQVLDARIDAFNLGLKTVEAELAERGPWDVARLERLANEIEQLLDHRRVSQWYVELLPNEQRVRLRSLASPQYAITSLGQRVFELRVQAGPLGTALNQPTTQPEQQKLDQISRRIKTWQMGS